MSLVGEAQNEVSSFVTGWESAIFGPSTNTISGPSTVSALGGSLTTSPVFIIAMVAGTVLLLKWLKIL